MTQLNLKLYVTCDWKTPLPLMDPVECFLMVRPFENQEQPHIGRAAT